MEEGFSDAEIRAIREWIATARKREEIRRRGEAVRKVKPSPSRRTGLSKRQGVRERKRAAS